MQTLSATTGIQQGLRPLTRCTRSQPEQAPVSPCGFTADGFLNHRFLPLYEPAAELPEIKDLETGVFNSLSIFEKQYDIKVMDVSDKPHPYNILLAYWNAEQQVCKGKSHTELCIISDDADKVKLATKEYVSTGHTLYYIPILPLYRLLKSGKDKRSAELLMSVCAYLYHITGIPYYRDEDSFLFYHYEILEDWIENDVDQMDERDVNSERSALYSANYYGDIMQRKLHNQYHLEHFAERVQQYRAHTDFEEGCLKLAKDALDLWSSFPNGILFRHVNDSFPEKEDSNGEDNDDGYYDEMDSTIRLSEIVHFIAENEGSLYDSLSEMVNSEFNEKSSTQEPVLIRVYDEQLAGNTDTLDFERRLFELIDNLCILLNDLP
ncbi:hypothetical protein [Mucilaginibacter gilvus]|uniref:Uncharacterized protein n=1 Tax=Mucilaginibacter gilvus TaxID=2305909 RepID=A0A3S3V947_9SPHI|nr:hypothetical protein [Mucilaginibacter gilvus]RWY48336.1 hypothetical protein EPL05_19530 [Mucilaginibacter gilvus]